jgi:hypothetical protein
MEIPMWGLQSLHDADLYHNMDPEEADAASLLQMFQQNFTLRYQGNRAPMGIWLHRPWLGDVDGEGGFVPHPDHMQALHDFLTWALAQEDVWVVPMGHLADWMRNPLPADHPDLPPLIGVQPYVPVPPEEALFNAWPGGFYSLNETLHSAPLDHPETLMMQLAPAYSGLQFYFEEDPTLPGYILRVDNPSDQAFAHWEVTIDPQGCTVPAKWNLNVHALPGGHLLLSSEGVWSTLIPAQSTGHAIADFWTQEDFTRMIFEAGLGLQPAPVPPLLSMVDRRVEWNLCAPMFELQGASDLRAGDWQPITTFYGETATSVPHDSSFSFFRLQPIY